MRRRVALLILAPLLAVLVLAGCSPGKADPRVGKFAKLPDWRGVWVAEGAVPEISGFVGPPPAGTKGRDPYPLAGVAAPWNEAGRVKFQAMIAAQGNRKSNGWGFPMMMAGSAPLQFVITPEETLILSMYRDVRHVYTDGRDHPAADERWATTWGDSVGHWEGDTLVVDTVSVTDPLKFLFFAPPLTEQAHYLERLRLAAPDRIESEITIEDPQVLTGPWKEKVSYIRQPGLDRLIHDDYVNDRSDLRDGVFTIEPKAL